MILKELFYDWAGLNSTLAQHIYSIRETNYDQLMVLVSKLGHHPMFPYYFALVCVWALVDIGVKYSIHKTGRWFIMSWVVVLFTLVVGYVEFYVLIKTFKDWFAYPRPFVAEPTIFKMLGEEIVPEKFYQSFPSGHAAFSAMVVASVWPKLKDWAKWVGFAFVVAVCWSRVSLGVHYPADVVVGSFIMFITVVISRYFISGILRSPASV